MPNLVISLTHTGRLAKAFAGRRHRGKLCSVNLWMALAVPNDVCRWHIATFRCDSPPWSLLEGIADMNGRVASAKNVEIDPERKLNAPRSGMVTPASPR